jgi:hypothetical protein
LGLEDNVIAPIPRATGLVVGRDLGDEVEDVWTDEPSVADEGPGAAKISQISDFVCPLFGGNVILVLTVRGVFRGGGGG